jgi:putative hydrolase of the HAD superfamily
MKKYKHIFFDLDHTLWNFDRNSEETLIELYHSYKLADVGIASCSEFTEAYKQRNLLMWEQFRLGEISKADLRSNRFAHVFKDIGINEKLVPQGISEDYQGYRMNNNW